MLFILLLLFGIGFTMFMYNLDSYFGELLYLIAGIVLMIPLIVSLIFFRPEVELIPYEEYDIYALTDNIMVEGGGGLLFHYIDSDLNYHVRVDYKDGKKTIELDGDKVFLVETPGQTKVVIYKERRTTNTWLWSEWGSTVDIKIYVPEGTMVDQYNSDME